MIKYSIHTLQLQAQLSPDNYKMFYNVLSKMNLSIEKKEYTLNMPSHDRNHFCTFRHLTDCAGINSVSLLTHTNNCFTKHYAYIYANPYNALHKHQNSTANIIDNSEIAEAMGIIQNYLSTLFPFFPLNAYSLNRLDFCLDIKFPNQKKADEYIKLLKKGIPRKVLHEKTHFDKTQRRFIPYHDSLLLECKSYSFEVYSKYRQMTLCKMKNPDAASGVARLELRASKRKIQSLSNKYGLPSPKVEPYAFIARSPEITKKEIPYIISKMTGSGSFHSYNYVIKQIENSTYNKNTKKLMTQIVFYISKHKNCGHLCEDFQMMTQTWNLILEKFNNLGCSPIPIPRTYAFYHYPGVDEWKSFSSN